jgi:hypothetical protein
MNDQQIIRFLAEKIMGGTLEECSCKIRFRLMVGKYGRHWNPLTSMADAFEVQAAIENANPMEYARCLMALVDPDGTALRNQLTWRVANATARQRCLAACQALGGDA